MAATAATLLNSSPDIFVYVGHGNEEPIPYNERPRVPERTTAVSFTKSGKPLPYTNASYVWTLMKTQPELFQDPLRNKDEIEEKTATTLRIYPEGAPMPLLNYWPESSFENATGIVNQFGLAGIYRFPLTAIFLKDTLSSPVLTSSQIDRFYQGEDNAELRAQLKGMISSTHPYASVAQIKTIKYTAPEVLSKYGKGIHYFLNCRYVADLREKSRAFMYPMIAEYEAFINDAKKGLQTKLKDIEAKLKKPNRNSNRANLQRQKTEIKELLDDFYEYERQLYYLQLIPDKNNLPEDKLIYFRHALAQNSYLNANHQKHEPMTNEQFNAQIRPKQNLASRHSTFKRNAVRKFNSTFGTLRARLPITRQKSQEFQRSLMKTRRRR
jgi:hypothetical protein